ncbi:hypothetical protein BKA69DRAFT_581998 [Paraphysoderma sedebokerense]|nr:hypothetical protein BKA69DRAFT_581998 [Paraphysoderma sedebokerense]
MTDTAVRQKPSSFPVSALIDETSSRDESISTSQGQEQTSNSETSQPSDDDNSMDIEGEGMSGDVNGESDDKDTEVGKTDSSVTNTGRQSRKRLPKLVAMELQKIFETNDTPSFDVREELGKKFGMTNREVQVWFQNKRAKLSRLTKLQSQQQLQQQNAGAAAPNSGPMLKSTKRWAPPPPIQIQTKNLSHRPIPILPSPTSSNTPLYVSSNSTKVQVAVPSYPVVPVVPAVSQVAKQDAGISSTHRKLSIRPVVPNIVTHGKAARVAVPYYAYYPVYANHPGGVYMYPSYQNVTPISPTYVYPTQPKSAVVGAASPKSPKSKSKSPSKLSISTDTATATSPKVKSTPSIPTPILPRPSYSWPMPMPIAGYPVYPSTWHRVMSAAMSTYGPMHQGAHPNTNSIVPIAPTPNNSSKGVEKFAKANNPKSISQISTAAEDVTHPSERNSHKSYRTSFSFAVCSLKS